MEITLCEVVQEAGKLVARCPVEHESWLSLLMDWNHWLFEYISNIPQTAVNAAFMWLAWPYVGPPIVRVWNRVFHRHSKCCVAGDNNAQTSGSIQKVA